MPVVLQIVGLFHIPSLSHFVCVLVHEFSFTADFISSGQLPSCLSTTQGIARLLVSFRCHLHRVKKHTHTYVSRSISGLFSQKNLLMVLTRRNFFDSTDSLVSRLLGACHCVGPGITEVNATLPLRSAGGICHALPFLFRLPLSHILCPCRCRGGLCATRECLPVPRLPTPGAPKRSVLWASEGCWVPCQRGRTASSSPGPCVSVFSGPGAVPPSPFLLCPLGQLHPVFITSAFFKSRPPCAHSPFLLWVASKLKVF